MNFYTSDLHLFHKNVIHLSNRPFKDIDDMHNALIENWNKKVKTSDIVYILGDIGYPKKSQDIKLIINFLKKLNGKKILIVGNHDFKLLNYPKFKDEFIEIHNYLEISDFNRKIILFHYPIEEWNGYFKNSIHLFGHIHKNDKFLKDIKNRYNVGMDVNNFTPISMQEILEKLSNNK